MTAEVLRYNVSATPVVTSPGGSGTWTTNQDPITGEIITTWVPGELDDPSTPLVNEATDHVIIPCFVQGIYNSGIRAAGSDERFGMNYYNIEYLKMWTPAGIRLNKRDRITNIKDGNGNIAFIDEEYEDRITIFNVQGVTPRFDPFNRPIDQFVLLEKVQ